MSAIFLMTILLVRRDPCSQEDPWRHQISRSADKELTAASLLLTEAVRGKGTPAEREIDDVYVRRFAGLPDHGSEAAGHAWQRGAGR
jgi:hypothetical protein